MYVITDICTYICIHYCIFSPLNDFPIILYTTKGFEIRCFQIVFFYIKRLLQILKTINWFLESFLKIRFSPPPGPVCKKDDSTINCSSICFTQLNNKNEAIWNLRDKSPPTFLLVSALSLWLRCIGSMWEILGSTPGR